MNKLKMYLSAVPAFSNFFSLRIKVLEAIARVAKTPP